MWQARFLDIEKEDWVSTRIAHVLSFPCHVLCFHNDLAAKQAHLNEAAKEHDRQHLAGLEQHPGCIIQVLQ